MITSLRNPRVAAARKLRRTRERRETGRTTIEGPLLLEEAIAGAITIHEVYVLPIYWLPLYLDAEVRDLSLIQNLL